MTITLKELRVEITLTRATQETQSPDDKFARRGRAGRRRKRLGKLEPYLYLAPVLIFFGVFAYYPLVTTIFRSFFLQNSMGELREFTGFENYATVLSDPNFLRAIVNTLIFAAVTTPTYVIIALVLAMVAARRTRTSAIYETFFSLTMAMSMSVAAMIFQLMFNPSIGIINNATGLKINWLNDPNFALLSIMIVSVWLNIGYNFLFVLAALRSISPDILEGVALDGANIWQRTTKVILPMISPTVFFLVISQLSKNMMMSGLVLVLTQGGPQGSTQTMISYMYYRAVSQLDYNTAYAAAVVAFLITLVFIVGGFAIEKRKVHYS